MRTLKEFLLMTVAIVGFMISLPTIPAQVLYRLFSKFDHAYYFHQIAIACDVAIGSFVYGSRHTVSAITGQKAFNGSKYHRVQEKTIDAFFGAGHCFKEALKENLLREK